MSMFMSCWASHVFPLNHTQTQKRKYPVKTFKTETEITAFIKPIQHKLDYFPQTWLNREKIHLQLLWSQLQQYLITILSCIYVNIWYDTYSSTCVTIWSLYLWSWAVYLSFKRIATFVSWSEGYEVINRRGKQKNVFLLHRVVLIF